MNDSTTSVENGQTINEEQSPEKQKTEKTAERPCNPKGYPHFEIDFSTFVISLSQSALVHLGLAKDPDGRSEVTVPLAKQTIDILGMLFEKTKGNLAPEEHKLLTSVLCDVRVKFVKVANTSSDGI